MTPFFFGPEDHPLFGVYHPPDAADRRAGVVLCYPLFTEYEHAHWPFRKLAVRLARAGFHVLRFDYTGTGDSHGDLEEGSPKKWREDVGAAVKELKELAGLRSVSLVGLRLGAALAFEVACAREDVGEVVLWEPVVRGNHYLREMEDLEEDRRRWSRHPLPRDTNALLAYPFVPNMRHEIAGLDLLGTPSGFKGRVVMLAAEDRPEQRELARRLETDAQSVQLRIQPAAPSGALGDEALRILVAALEEGTA